MHLASLLQVILDIDTLTVLDSNLKGKKCKQWNNYCSILVSCFIMMEFSLEDDLPEEFKGGTLSLHPTNSKTPTEPKQILNNNEQQIDKGEIDNENNTSWKSGVITIPQRSK